MSGNKVDAARIQHYLTHRISTPSPWIFVRDASCIFPDLPALKLFDRRYEVVVYDGDLQVRRKLERFKDEREKFCACIISRQPPELERHILDYIVRSRCVELTPQAVLEFAPPGYRWTREVNQLVGEDFWSLFEPLQRRRPNYPRAMTPAEATNLLLSARLDVDLQSNLSAHEAVNIWRRLEEDAELIAWGRRHPRLFQALNLKARAALPLMEKLAGDDDFVRFLWTSYALSQHNQHYDLFLPQIFGDAVWKKYANTAPEEIQEACAQLVKNNPRRVIDQIKQTEIWLTQDSQRYALFLRWVGVDASNLDKTVDYAKRERLLCAPLREALRLLATHLCHSPEAFARDELQKIIDNLRGKHLFCQDDTNYLRIRETFRAFATLVELNQLIAAEGRRASNTGNQTRLADAIAAYVDFLSKVELAADALELLNFQCNLLPNAAMVQALDRARELVNRRNAAFAQEIAFAFPAWITARRTAPPLTVDFLDAVFLPRYRKYIKAPPQAAYVFIFDGMRWDAWRTIQPKVLQAFQGKFAFEGVFPLVSILPTTTMYNKYALFTGEFPADEGKNWWEALAKAFEKRGIRNARWASDGGNSQTQILNLLEAEDVAVKVFNLTFIDHKLHYAKQNLSTVYEEIKINFDLLVQPYLERIPRHSLVFLLSDHGFIEATTQREIETDFFQPGSVSTRHPRYATLSSAAALSAPDFVLFDAGEIGLPPTNGRLRYGFATLQTQIQTNASPEDAPRYVHGGVSMQEMVAPCAIFTPTGEGQLEIW
jgi:hypothetical protein